MSKNVDVIDLTSIAVLAACAAAIYWLLTNFRGSVTIIDDEVTIGRPGTLDGVSAAEIDSMFEGMM